MKDDCIQSKEINSKNTINNTYIFENIDKTSWSTHSISGNVMIGDQLYKVDRDDSNHLIPINKE